MDNKKIYSLLGLSTRAGKLKSGEFSVLDAIRSGKAYAVIVSEDASDNTKKLFSNMCEFYEVPFAVFGSKEELGHCIGKTYRASICILDEGFAKTVKDKISLCMED